MAEATRRYARVYCQCQKASVPIVHPRKFCCCVETRKRARGLDMPQWVYRNHWDEVIFLMCALRHTDFWTIPVEDLLVSKTKHDQGVETLRRRWTLRPWSAANHLRLLGTLWTWRASWVISFECGTMFDQNTYLIVAAVAKFAAQQIFRIRAISVVSAIRWRYGLSLAASDLWKFASNERRSRASNVYISVFGSFMICYEKSRWPEQTNISDVLSITHRQYGPE